MAGKRYVITGATGLLGSHVAEQLVARGDAVRAFVRPTSDTTFLKSLGADLSVGDLADSASIRRAVEGADVVFHCAAKVGEWGPWRNFQEQIIDATSNLLTACRDAGVGRVVHVSSITVYGHPTFGDGQLTEDAPLGRNLWWWDRYVRAKMKAEELCRAYPGDLVVMRPSWIYGPRDRNTLPRVLKALGAGRFAILGRGDNLINVIYAGDVADGLLRAADRPETRGRAYNFSTHGEVTQKQFLDFLTDSLGYRRARWHFPPWLAFAAGFTSEVIGRAIRLKRPPHLTRYAVGLIFRSTKFSIERARVELGWQPRTPVFAGLEQTLKWFREHGGLTR